MADSYQYRSWIAEARREQRTLRDAGCYVAARRLDAEIDADYCSLSRAMALESEDDSDWHSDIDDDH
jgi:hypothetical protein